MDKAKQAWGTFGKILPDLNEQELEVLLAFGQGMAFKASQEKARPQDTGQSAARPSA